jgi:hypothetical protein
MLHLQIIHSNTIKVNKIYIFPEVSEIFISAINFSVPTYERALNIATQYSTSFRG